MCCYCAQAETGAVVLISRISGPPNLHYIISGGRTTEASADADNEGGAEIETIVKDEEIQTHHIVLGRGVPSPHVTLATRIWRKLILEYQRSRTGSRNASVAEANVGSLVGDLHMQLKLLLRDDTVPKPLFIKKVPKERSNKAEQQKDDAHLQFVYRVAPASAIVDDMMSKRNGEFHGRLDSRFVYSGLFDTTFVTQVRDNIFQLLKDNTALSEKEQTALKVRAHDMERLVDACKVAVDASGILRKTVEQDMLRLVKNAWNELRVYSRTAPVKRKREVVPEDDTTDRPRHSPHNVGLSDLGAAATISSSTNGSLPISSPESHPKANEGTRPDVDVTATSKQGPAARTEKVLVPSNLDVVCGRGGLSNNHIGNKRYLEEVVRLQGRYRVASRLQKREIAKEVLNFVKEGGRFLRKEEKSELWVPVDEQHTMEKITQALRSYSRSEKSGA